MSFVALGAVLALCGLVFVWSGYETDRQRVRVDSLEDRLMALEARQSRLQRIVEKGWSQSLDLTSFDWSRQSVPPDEDG